MHRIVLLTLIVVSCKQVKTPLEEAHELFDKQQYYTALERLASVSDNYYCEREELKGHCYWAIQVYSGAVEVFENLLDTCSGNIEVYINLGDSYYKEENDSLAHYYFKKAYKIDSTNHIVNYNLGLMNYNFYYGYAAKKYFTNAVNYTPNPNEDYFDILIETLCELEEFDSAFLVNERFINETSGQALNHALLRKAFIYGDMKEFKRCINDINSILSTKELNSYNRYNAYYNRYICWVELGDTSNACSDYQLLKTEEAKNLVDFFNCDKSI